MEVEVEGGLESKGRRIAFGKKDHAWLRGLAFGWFCHLCSEQTHIFFSFFFFRSVVLPDRNRSGWWRRAWGGPILVGMLGNGDGSERRLCETRL